MQGRIDRREEVTRKIDEISGTATSNGTEIGCITVLCGVMLQSIIGSASMYMV